ncbi:DNA-processing protein DprA [Mangrovihabitans endophyticus]|uniref:Smf/DprA SLOG domain-containing protein n=1 Tax=Mangrovihabitans endophyticus TaxID=1751298 RepID=A0A8J3FRL4_9ACTN|nr:DNA-processing protein DprA [Mangrovihabitans endophyticus]GGL12789.1 hypothetical protein GCM10012284_54350 [Mangrovihabitans endophyticus]
MSTDLETVRTARAALALLPRNRDLHELLVTLGPVDALAWLLAPHPSEDDREQMLCGVTVAELREHAASIGERTGSVGARLLIPEDPDWPARLDDLTRVAYAAAPSCALCLWARGHTDPGPAGTGVIAVTGSRAATGYGAVAATGLGHDLTARGWRVATGSGFGIDSAALRGALAVGGPATAVVPAGLDRLHPAGNTQLLEQVADHGMLITAEPPGSLATSRRSAAAYRQLAGVTDGVVVVEAARGSATLTVLTEAIARGRTAMVVPGPVTAATSAGTLQFLRDHRQARLVRDAADVIADMPDLHR